jgi:hypothetical protein
MKRMIILVVIASVIGGMLYADEETLIDFTKLAADMEISTGRADYQSTTPNQNRQTMMEYGQAIGSTYTADQRALMRTSLAIENWDIVFNSSAETIANVSNSKTKEAESTQFGTVMGVRVHYPLGPSYAKATIKPPFEIPAYEWGEVDDDGNVQRTNSYQDGLSRFESGYGVLKNVGTIRSVAVQVYGLNFPHGLNVILIDSQGNEKLCFMGYLNFDGWAELTWNNPQYIMEVRNRDLRLYPLYPWNEPFIKFGGFRIDRDADAIGGDFITYFKEVKVIFDKANLDVTRDIDDEKTWEIIWTRESENRLLEMEKFGEAQLLRFLDNQRQSTEPWDPIGLDGDPYNYGFNWDN